VSTQTPKPSTYKVAKAELVRLLREHEDLVADNVFYGRPVPPVPLELVAVIPADPSEEQWGYIGNERRVEEYFLAVAVGVVIRNGTQQQATERCEDLYAAVEHVLRTNPNLGGVAVRAGVELCEIVRTRREETIEPEGRGAGATGLVRVKARTRA
jgi:hypothetical protein